MKWFRMNHPRGRGGRGGRGGDDNDDRRPWNSGRGGRGGREGMDGPGERRPGFEMEQRGDNDASENMIDGADNGPVKSFRRLPWKRAMFNDINF